MGLNTINRPGTRLITALTATGTTQTDAFPLIGGTAFHEFTTVASGTGCRMPVSPLPITVVISNAGAETLNVYPPSGGTIDGGSTDAAVTIAATKSGSFWAAGPLTWYSTTTGTVTGGGTGTVTQLVAGYGLDGGTITTTGTLAISDLAITFAKMQTIASLRLIGRVDTGAGAPTQLSLTEFLDAAAGSAQGDILYRGASAWSVLAPGTSGQLLASQGASANPHWIDASGTGTVTSVAAGTGLTGGTITGTGTIGLASISGLSVLGNSTGGSAAPAGITLTGLIDSALGSTQGDILYRGASAWSALGPGTAGQPLTTGGSAANPGFASTNVKVDSHYGAITGDTQSTGTWTANLATSDWHEITLTQSITTLTLSNPTVGQQFTLVVIQGGSGSYTISWFSTIKWAGGAAPTLTTAVGGIDVLTFKCMSAGQYYGFVAGQALA